MCQIMSSKKLTCCFDHRSGTVYDEWVYHPTCSNFIQELLYVKGQSTDEEVRALEWEDLFGVAIRSPWTLVYHKVAIVKLYAAWYNKYCEENKVWPVVTVKSWFRPEVEPYFWIHLCIPRKSERKRKKVNKLTYI